jgi:hypothetical protein
MEKLTDIKSFMHGLIFGLLIGAGIVLSFLVK